LKPKIPLKTVDRNLEEYLFGQHREDDTRVQFKVEVKAPSRELYDFEGLLSIQQPKPLPQ